MGGNRILWRKPLGHVAKVGVGGSNPLARSKSLEMSERWQSGYAIVTVTVWTALRALSIG